MVSNLWVLCPDLRETSQPSAFLNMFILPDQTLFSKVCIFIMGNTLTDYSFLKCINTEISMYYRADGLYCQTAMWAAVSHRVSDWCRRCQHCARVCNPCCSGLRWAGLSTVCLLHLSNLIIYRVDLVSLVFLLSSSHSLVFHTLRFCVKTAMLEELLSSQTPAWGS